MPLDGPSGALAGSTTWTASASDPELPALVAALRFCVAVVSCVRAFATAAVWLVIGLIALNVVSTLLECGFGACAENPVVYELLRHGA